ncbi:MAG: IS3 family transposase [Gemmatimonadaceae bacterium]
MATTTRFEASAKAALLRCVRQARDRTGWSVRRILSHLGLTKARYREWLKREARDALTDRPPVAWNRDGILERERDAVQAYARAHPRDGYRRLTWQMLDADVACLSESSVYRILREADLLFRWKRSAASGPPPAKPTRPHQRWHTDLMYLRIADSWYFLVTVLDAYSRYVVHWELLTTMTAADVRLVIQQAVEATGARPQVVTDSGSQFTSAEFKDLVRRFALEHIRIRTYHPESNGAVERFHRTTREALGATPLTNLGQARAILGEWVRYYNEERLHAALGYLPPAEYYRGNPTQRQTERAEKLERARQERRRENDAQLTRAA